MERGTHPGTLWRADLATYLAVAFGAAWLIALPLWVRGDPLTSPLLAVTGPAMMFAPSLAVVAVRLRAHRDRSWREWARSTGLTVGPRPSRTLLLIAVGWLVPPVLVVVAVALSAAVGVLELDLWHLGALRELLPAQSLQLPGGAVTALVLVAGQSLLLGTGLTTIFAAGEEWGWRGWLQRHLIARWGVTAGLVVTGVIWGLWHAPLTLRGYNYPGLGAWAALYFVPFTVLAALLLGRLREACGSIWPAAVGHASINSTASFVAIVVPATYEVDTALAGLTGVVGWVLGVAVVVAVWRRWPPAPSARGEREPVAADVTA